MAGILHILLESCKYLKNTPAILATVLWLITSGVVHLKISKEISQAGEV
jgi:hypothetical protein